MLIPLTGELPLRLSLLKVECDGRAAQTGALTRTTPGRVGRTVALGKCYVLSVIVLRCNAALNTAFCSFFDKSFRSQSHRRLYASRMRFLFFFIRYVIE